MDETVDSSGSNSSENEYVAFRSKQKNFGVLFDDIRDGQMPRSGHSISEEDGRGEHERGEDVDNDSDALLNRNSVSSMLRELESEMSFIRTYSLQTDDPNPIDELMAQHEKSETVIAAQNTLIKELKQHCKHQDQIMQEMKSEIMDLNIKKENEFETNRRSITLSTEEVMDRRERILRSSSSIEAADAIKVGHKDLMEKVKKLEGALATRDHSIADRNKRIKTLRKRMALMKQNTFENKKKMANIGKKKEHKNRDSQLETKATQQERRERLLISQTSKQRKLMNIIKRHVDTITALKEDNEELKDECTQLTKWNEELSVEHSSVSDVQRFSSLAVQTRPSDNAEESYSFDAGLADDPIKPKARKVRRYHTIQLSELPFILWLVIGLLTGMGLRVYAKMLKIC